jgi:formylglycine-generating enzyme required for sulfatase activity
MVFSILLWGSLAWAAASPPPNQNCKECHITVPQLTGEKCQVCHFSPAPPENTDLEPMAVTRVMPVVDQKARSPFHDMVLIPAGTFIMGYDKRWPDEGPSHTVNLGDYYIDKYEVTNAQYAEFVNATHRKPPFYWRTGRYPPEKARHPVVMVSWHDATEYCQWAGKRLPTEEEWEKAARGTDGRIFPWGNTFDINRANTPQRWKALDQPGDTMPVGSFPQGKSPYGLYDMAGNVWEWTESWYLPHPGNTHITENYGQKYKVAKGGSWKDCSFYRCGISGPTFNRGFFDPNTTTRSFGFRCARDVPAVHPKK